MIYREQNTERALSPTSITIADYVINPYAGCDFNCTYCYGKMNSTYQKKKKRLGDDYVEYKPNFLTVLKKELDEKKPTHVLIGSTTEAFQLLEQKKRMTRGVLRLLNERGISYTILTKSQYCINELPAIVRNSRNEVYFTLNTLDENLRKWIEPAASTIEQRLETIRALIQASIRTVIHVGPYLPLVSDAEMIMRSVAGAALIEFENLNLKMAEKTALFDALNNHDPKIVAKIMDIYSHKPKYDAYYTAEKDRISQLSEKYSMPVKFFFYEFNSFYDNSVTY